MMFRLDGQVFMRAQVFKQSSRDRKADETRRLLTSLQWRLVLSSLFAESVFPGWIWARKQFTESL